jgi:hypothetical protein
LSRSLFTVALCVIGAIQSHADFSWVVWMQGGSSTAVSVSSDNHGNSYIIGSFSGTVSFGSNTLTSAGASDVFVAKIGRKGGVAWVISADGTNDDAVQKIFATPTGSVFITGTFGSDATLGGESGLNGAFLAKISKHGSVEWLRTLTNMWVNTAFLDHKRRVWIAGTHEGFLSFSAWNERGQAFPSIVSEVVGFSPSHLVVDRKGAFYVTRPYGGNVLFGSNFVSGFKSIITAKLDPDGQSQWADSVSFYDSPRPTGIAVARNGSTIVGGDGSFGFLSAGYFTLGYSVEGSRGLIGTVSEYKGVRHLNGLTVDSRGRLLTIGNFVSSSVGGTPWYRGAFINGPGFGIVVTNTAWPPGPYTAGTITPRDIAVKLSSYTFISGDFSGPRILEPIESVPTTADLCKRLSPESTTQRVFARSKLRVHPTHHAIRDVLSTRCAMTSETLPLVPPRRTPRPRPIARSVDPLPNFAETSAHEICW